MIQLQPQPTGRNGRRDLRVLLIAESANPEWPSVPLEGWSHSQAIARVTDAHLITQVRNREAILKAGLPENCFTAIDSERVAGPVYRCAEALCGGNGRGWTTKTAAASLSYYYFERLVWKQFGSRIKAGEFDVVHRLTPLSPTVPSLLATACHRAGVPFVLGPLNGGVPWPRGFDATRRREREWLSYVRNAYRVLPGYRATRRDAAAIIIGSRDTWRQMPARYRHKCIYIPENGLDHSRFSVARSRQPVRPLRAIFVGRLVPYKGADMLVEAVEPLVRAGLMSLTIVGDGPEMPRIRQMVADAQLDEGVHLPGWIDHRRLQEHLAEADIFAFPSIREFGGAVVLEAMAAGVVPIVVDYGGPGELVTDATGYRIPIGRRRQLIEGFRAILAAIVRDPQQLVSRSATAMQRVHSRFTWEAKARQCLEVYRWVTWERPDKPDFGMPLPDVPDTPEPMREVFAGRY